MERYKEGQNRNQLELHLTSYDDMIGSENPVRAIDAIVNKMDIPSLGFQYTQTAVTGRKAYNPVDMFKLYTYSYFNGIRSSRKIERECHRNIEVMWLLGGLAPDFKTIADFRKNNKVAADGDIALTDPDCKRMPVANTGFDVCYNVQTAVDSKNHLVVAVGVTNSPLDKEQLFPMALQVKQELGLECLQVVADRGYYSAKQFKLCAENGMIVIAPKPIHPSRTKQEQYAKEYFHYDLDSDTYTCPQRAVLLHAKRRAGSKTPEERYVNRVACQSCQKRQLCTTGDFGTIVEKPFERFADAVDERTKENPRLVLLRKCLVEHPFGTVKRAFGFTYFLTRGMESVRAESCLHFLAYNLKRVINIMGVNGAMAACPV